MRERYDYIVVGAGSAGCAVANVLSANPTVTVLLLESGPSDDSLFIRMPRGLGVTNRAGSKYIWEYSVETGANEPAERWFRGRTLGGSSAVNGMIYMRGAPRDYDGWRDAGCTGWGWSDVGPLFQQLENHSLGAGTGRGVDGPLRVSVHPEGNPLFAAILQAGMQMGIRHVRDVNDPKAVKDGGLGYQPSTLADGQRFSAARAFLVPARNRKNLDVVTSADVLTVGFENKRATHVRMRHEGRVRSIAAAAEIAICAGAIETPKLLQRSGVGPGSLLRALGIETVVDAPDVGSNLREHRHVDLPLRVRSNSQNQDLGGLRAGWSMLRYLVSKSGPMTHGAHEVGGFAKSDPGLDHADLQFGLMSLSASSFGKDGSIALDPFPGITFVTYFTRPESKGVVQIQSADPDLPALIAANHLSADVDRQKFVAAFRWNRRLAAQAALRPWVVGECQPTASLQTDDDILEHAMAIGGTCFHTAGTARMGADPQSVVDPQLRVRGVMGLRIIDTSIMPTLVSGNTNGPAMMIGLRGAQFMASQQTMA